MKVIEPAAVIFPILLTIGSLVPDPACAAPTPPPLTITLTPAAAAVGGNIPYVAVQVVVPAMHVIAGARLLRLPRVSSNVATAAGGLEDLRVTDSTGTVPLRIRDDPPCGLMFFRRWYAGRAVAGTLTIGYRAPITNALNPRGATPPLELRTEEGGFSGDASTFLVLPDSDRTYRIALRWNLAALGPKAVGSRLWAPGTLARRAPIRARSAS